jgi:hypothetical protein
VTPKGFHAFMRWIRRARKSFPDTKPADLLGRMRDLDRRRAKNKRARASRKANRR